MLPKYTATDPIPKCPSIAVLLLRPKSLLIKTLATLKDLAFPATFFPIQCHQSGVCGGRIMSDFRGTQILTLNSGSSSLKFAVYRVGDRDRSLRSLIGSIDRIGLIGSRFSVQGDGRPPISELVDCYDHDAAIDLLLSRLKTLFGGERLDAIGHRFVHGGDQYREPQLVTPTLLETIHSLIHLAPDHLPHQLKVVRAIQRRYPGFVHVACFDTAFHRRMPEIAQRYPLPSNLWESGVRRYGFHGLSYEYIVDELKSQNVAAATDGRLLIAHLGNGASMAAIDHEQPVDTTMGLTPTGGLMMGSRSGDLDPGVLIYLLREKGFGIRTIDDLVNHHAGLVGIAGMADMQELLQRESNDPRAAMAVELFCYQTKKMLGAMAASLGGLDLLVFTAGIGAHAPTIRRRICEGLEFLGVRLDSHRNGANDAIISRDDSPVQVRAMQTDEEWMIARHTYQVFRSLDRFGAPGVVGWTPSVASPVSTQP
jgi:acetate kinase